MAAEHCTICGVRVVEAGSIVTHRAAGTYRHSDFPVPHDATTDPPSAAVVARVADWATSLIESQDPDVWSDPLAAEAADRLVAALAVARGYET